MGNDESGSNGNTKHGPRTAAISASLITSFARVTGDLVDRTAGPSSAGERENNDRRDGHVNLFRALFRRCQKLPLTKTSSALERKKRAEGRKFVGCRPDISLHEITFVFIFVGCNAPTWVDGNRDGVLSAIKGQVT